MAAETAVAILAGASAAYGQTTGAVPPSAPPAAAGTIDRAECRPFAHYLAADAKAHHDGKLSPQFVDSITRFLRAGCKAYDDKGPIQIITMNPDDRTVFVAAQMLMGNGTDVIEVSGVPHCDNPPSGVCRSTSGAAPVEQHLRGPATDPG
jgi:hypothetical protein